MWLDKKRVIVIGGSSGMGLAIAKIASLAGADILIAGRSAEKLQKAKMLFSLGRIETMRLDVTREKGVMAFFEKAGDFDHLVITAATGVTGMFLELDTKAARSVFESKFWGQYLSAKYAAPKIRPGGSITLFSGVAAVKPLPGFSAFSAVNGAIEALCRALAVELAPIRVNAVSPGIVDTPAYEGMPEMEREGMFKAVAEKLPVKRIGTPEDIAQAVISIMQNGYTTGSVLYIDGGHRLV